MATVRAPRKIDPVRRAEIGAEKRSRTRAELLGAAVHLFGRPHGRNTRIEDVCARAHVARGTFYNYFPGIEALLEALSDSLTADFDAAVVAAFAHLDTTVERTSAAIRYHLHAPLLDSRWGWAIVNSSVGAQLYGEQITRRVQASIQEGIDTGEFRISSAQVGRDILLGSGISATISLLNGGMPEDYPEQIANYILRCLGASARVAARATNRPMRQLPQLATDPQLFRGTLGGAGHGRKV